MWMWQETLLQNFVKLEVNLTFFAPWLPWQRPPFWIFFNPQKLPHTMVDIPTKFHEVWWKDRQTIGLSDYRQKKPAGIKLQYLSVWSQKKQKKQQPTNKVKHTYILDTIESESIVGLYDDVRLISRCFRWSVHHYKGPTI